MDVLTIKDKQILNGFIGGEPKCFTKIYSARNNGCDATTFHQKCDNKGPTVTLMFNDAEEVYGGYTSISWLSRTGKFMYDSKAFLFLLSTESGCDPMKFTVLNPECAVFHDKGTGPSFGSGPDLLVFKGKAELITLNKTFSLNTIMKPKDFKHQPTSLGRNVKDEFNIRDVVVYQVQGIIYAGIF